MEEQALPVSNVAARLHVLLARDAPFAVILRRGPSKQVCSIGWNLHDDTFKVGQWLKGRVYERLCDLSPDGRYLLYYATKHRVVDGGWLEYTVLSRAPYLKALKIWKGEGSYGGTFIDKDHFALNGMEAAPKIFRVSPFGEVKNRTALAQIRRISDQAIWKLQRGDWNLSDEPKTQSTFHWDKTLADWQLRLTIQGNYFYPKRITYTLHNSKSEEMFDCARWQWADFREKRVLWAQEGKILAAKIWEGGRGPTKQLADFNDWTFEPIAAPY